MGAISAKYRLGERIGGGGMAEVFRATLIGAEGFSRPVAIKRMLPSLSSDPAFGEMFINEARIAALLHHENIASIVDFDRDDEGRYYLVMELIQGVDLREVERAGYIAPEISAYIIGEVLRGLDYAHELVHDGTQLRIVHRDISPHNVMLSWSGGVKVVDFGIAKALAATGISRTGQLKGKVGYMSPEQAHGHQLDGRSDLFAVGVMFHELLTGNRLFQGSTEPEVLARLLTQPIAHPGEVRPGVPEDFAKVAMRLLERNRDDRYKSAQDAREALLACTSLNPRAELGLREVLRVRFPSRASQHRAPSDGQVRDPSSVGLAPTMQIKSSDVADVRSASAEAMADTMATPGAHSQSITKPTATESPAAHRARRGIADPGPRHTPVSGTPTGAGQHAAATVTEHVGRSRTGLWIGGALAVAAVAIVSAVVACIGGQAAAVTLDASVAVAVAAPQPSLDAAAPAVTTSDAAIAAAAPPPDARVAQRPKDKKPVRPIRRPKEPDRPAVTGDPGKLEVIVTPWAEVIVDGKSRGQTPKTLALPPGKHKVTLRNPGLGKNVTITVTIKSGITKRLREKW
jgi:serine/threonine-protein kinase